MVTVISFIEWEASEENSSFWRWVDESLLLTWDVKDIVGEVIQQVKVNIRSDEGWKKKEVMES